jgi:hypothetical protein
VAADPISIPPVPENLHTLNLPGRRRDRFVV